MSPSPWSPRVVIGVLMNLLPGLRDLRAPLASGYLWLLVIWLLVADDVPDRTESTGITDDLYSLGDYVGRTPTLAALSFVAYLLGCVLAINGGQPFGSPLRMVGRLRQLPPLTRIFSPEADEQFNGHVFSIGQRAGRVVVPEEWSESRRDLWDQWVRAARLEFSSDSNLSWAEHCWVAWTAWVPLAVHSELPQLVTRLRVSSPPLFDEYDRTRAEAEFRLSVAPPIAIVSVIAASANWVGAGGIIAAALILASGLRRARAARDVIAQSLLTDNLDLKSSRWVSLEHPVVEQQFGVLDWCHRDDAFKATLDELDDEQTVELRSNVETLWLALQALLIATPEAEKPSSTRRSG